MAKPRAARINVTRTMSTIEFRRLFACWAAKVWRFSIGARAEAARWRFSGSFSSAQAEIDGRDRRGFGLGFEELALGEPEHAGEQHVREDLDRVVVIENARVVVLPAE